MGHSLVVEDAETTGGGDVVVMVRSEVLVVEWYLAHKNVEEGTKSRWVLPSRSASHRYQGRGGKDGANGPIAAPHSCPAAGHTLCKCNCSAVATLRVRA